ncbi:MAG: hypothetical protein H0T51_15160 [Pirellulales bacterium]|nr:hypothetical protein [Pirellulales bacterium]
MNIDETTDDDAERFVGDGADFEMVADGEECPACEDGAEDCPCDDETTGDEAADAN